MVIQLIYLQNSCNIYSTSTHKINDTITKKKIASKELKITT